MNAKQRLVVCLDGTWNNRDDNTNVLHHLSLVTKGAVSGADGSTVLQKKYYHEGVGTGVLDGITGGGFGFGLEENVRAAYSWIVQNYQDETRGEADEIYIFGFSRGAYTARSLVGFIGRCGLLRRGAPLTINQLWQHYCILGRQHEERSSRLEQMFGQSATVIRQISALVCDPWQVAAFEAKRGATPGPNPAAAPAVTPGAGPAPDRVPGQRVDNLSETEKLLVRWSRRVRVTYLGVYDTVGAMGIDALAIPLLKSKLALHHNMRPTTLIQSCRHALALDEHRSSFQHTPFVAFVGHETAGELQEGAREDLETSRPDAPTARQHWERTRKMWRRKIEQCWFVGAHSNVGGGYPDNRLAQAPLTWIMQGAADRGLVSEPMAHPSRLANPPPEPRDSFAQFAYPFWTMLFRARRFYRVLDPEPELRANAQKQGAVLTGYSLENINEEIHPSVFEHFADKPIVPPNLKDYARRKLAGSPSRGRSRETPELRAQWHALAAKELKHSWMGAAVLPHVALVLWATFAALGCVAIKELALARHGVSDAWVCGLAVGAFGLVFVDWWESRANLGLTQHATHPRKRAFLDSIYWTRSIGVLLCVIGLVLTIHHLLPLGWNEWILSDAWSAAWDVILRWWPVPAAAGLAMVLATALDDKFPAGRVRAACAGWAGGIAVLALIVAGLVLASSFVSILLGPVLQLGMADESGPAPDAAFAGLLLLLQAGAVYLLVALSWCGEPMARANLGSIVPLQCCLTPGAVKKRLDEWCHQLTGRDHAGRASSLEAECALSRIVGETLWRDIIGLIPVYTLVLLFGLWFAADRLQWSWLAARVDLGLFQVPRWLFLPLASALADYVEDVGQLRFLRRHAANRAPQGWMVAVTALMTGVKWICFSAAVVLTMAALAQGSWLSAAGTQNVGWRGVVTSAIALAAVTVVSVLGLGAVLYRLRNWRLRRQGAGKPKVAETGTW